MDSKKGTALRRTAKEVKRYSVLIKALSLAAATLMVITAIGYAVSYFYDKYGSFTVNLDKYDMVKQGLSLSETPIFSNPVSRLNANALKNMTNISGNDLPDNINRINGDHSGDNYIAYTFYLLNAGEDTVTYSYRMLISNVAKDVDEAVRIRVYTNDDTVVTYAKTKKDGSGPEAGTVEFLKIDTVFEGQRELFEPGTFDKYTVVIWLEGDDPECVDDILGGTMKVEMNFEIVEGS